MSTQFVGEIRIFGTNFAPVGWAFCNGQLLPISQNTALFSLIGTYYGGNGVSNFALPNLQGCMPLGLGDGPGLTQRTLGTTGGENVVTLLGSEIPSHSHAMHAVGAAGNQVGPASHAPAEVRGGSYSSVSNVEMGASALHANGGGQPHNNLPPFLTMNFVIALVGIFPARS